jgi:hypothetical protein
MAGMIPRCTALPDHLVVDVDVVVDLDLNLDLDLNPDLDGPGTYPRASAASPSAYGRRTTPRSVTSAVTSASGVTSNAG